MPRIASLHVYPIKGIAGFSVSRWPVERRGLLFDRRWMLIDADGKFVSQREHPTLCRFRPCPDAKNQGGEHRCGDRLVVTAPDGDTIDVPPADPTAERIDVSVWKGKTVGVSVSNEADAWFSAKIGLPLRLVYMPDDVIRPTIPEFSLPGDHVSFADAFPVLVASEASLDDLNSRLAEPLPMNRFRANIIVDGVDPFEEDTWPGFEAGGVKFRAAKRCARCAVTATDQETAVVGQEPLRTLATYRRDDGKVYFGAYFIPETEHILSVGDLVSICGRT